MKLSVIFDQLQYGELKGIKIGGADSCTGINTSDYPALITHINLALTTLHTRFPIRRETVHIQQHAEISTYFLDYDYAESNSASTQPEKYIKDSVSDPYNNNLLLIDSVTDEKGCDYYLNVINKCESLTTPLYNAINVPTPVDTNIMIVKYRANHPYISPATTKPEDIEVHVPQTFMRALTLFVAERVMATQISLEAVQVAQSFERKYETECLRIEQLGLINKDEVVKNLEVNKWV